MCSKEGSLDFSLFSLLWWKRLGLNSLIPFRNTTGLIMIMTMITSMSLPLVSKLKFLKMMLSSLSQRFICGTLGSGGIASPHPCGIAVFHREEQETQVT